MTKGSQALVEHNCLLVSILLENESELDVDVIAIQAIIVHPDVMRCGSISIHIAHRIRLGLGVLFHHALYLHISFPHGGGYINLLHIFISFLI